MNGIKSLVNPYNELFKKYLLSCFYFDILILPEHHCLPNELFELDNYKVFQNNRPILAGGSRRGSGGIAIAINNSVFETHTLVSVIKGIDGQIHYGADVCVGRLGGPIFTKRHKHIICSRGSFL